MFVLSYIRIFYDKVYLIFSPAKAKDFNEAIS